MNTEINGNNPATTASIDGQQPHGGLISPAAPFSAAAMARFPGLLNASAFTVLSTYAGIGRVFAATGTHRLTDDAGVDVVCAGSRATVRASNLLGNNVFNMEGSTSDYNITVSANVVRLAHKTNGGILELTMGTSAQKIVFSNGFLNLTKVGTVYKLGSLTLNATAQNVSVTGLNATETSTGLFVGQDSTFFRGSINTITDGVGAQNYNIAIGAKVTLNSSQGSNVYSFQGSQADYKVSEANGLVTITDASGGFLKFNARVINQTLKFADGTSVVRVIGGVVKLGGNQRMCSFRSNEI